MRERVHMICGVMNLAPPSPSSYSLYFVESPTDSEDEAHSSIPSPSCSSPSDFHLQQPLSMSVDSAQSLSYLGSGNPGLIKVPPHTGSYNCKVEISSKAWRSSHLEVDDSHEVKGRCNVSQGCKFVVMVIVSLAAIFGSLALLSWVLISRPRHPQLSMRNVVFQDFFMGEGTDSSGVPTSLVRLNCTIQLNIYNPATYFGLHVHRAEVILTYSQINMATSQVEGYIQAKRSGRTFTVALEAAKIPIYGGIDFSNSNAGNESIPLQLTSTLWSQYYIIGKVMKRKFQTRATCDLLLNYYSMASLESSCPHTPQT